uniref:Alkylglycerol monooxygenase n=1 Tax=Ditylenchus dipsaci TaxID=166011 RepID=A0A915EDJ5_9BILA
MHTSLLGSLGALSYVFNTPSHHRVHHGRNAYCIDRNFGGVLIIWDRMFHTFEAERTDEAPIYGLIANERTFNQLWLQFHTLKVLLMDKWRMRVLIEETKGETEPVFNGWKEKLRALFYRLDTSQVLRNTRDKVPGGQVQSPSALGIKAYCLAHFFVLLSAFLYFQYSRQTLNYLEFTLRLAFFVCTMQSFGAIFDGRSYAPFLEIFRCLGVITFFTSEQLLDGHLMSLDRIVMLTTFSFPLCFG